MWPPIRGTSTRCCSIRSCTTPTGPVSWSRPSRTPPSSCWSCCRCVISAWCCGPHSRRPYVMLCLVYSATFIYAFAALGEPRTDRARSAVDDVPVPARAVVHPTNTQGATPRIRMGAAKTGPAAAPSGHRAAECVPPTPPVPDDVMRTPSNGWTSTLGVGGSPSSWAWLLREGVGGEHVVAVDEAFDGASARSPSRGRRHGSAWCSARQGRHMPRDTRARRPRRGIRTGRPGRSGVRRRRSRSARRRAPPDPAGAAPRRRPCRSVRTTRCPGRATCSAGATRWRCCRTGSGSRG